MEKNQQQIDGNESDRSKQINDLKTTLINHYDDMKNKIDLRAQKILINIEKDESKKDETSIKEYQSKILDLNIEFVELCDQIFDKNMKQINNFNFINELNVNSLNDSCYWIDNRQMSSDNKKIYPLGVLIVADWYLSQNDINYFRAYFSETFIKNKCFNLTFDSNLHKYIFGSMIMFENIINLKKNEIRKIKSLNLKNSIVDNNYKIQEISQDSFADHGFNLEHLTINVSCYEKLIIRPNAFQYLNNLISLTISFGYKELDLSIINSNHMPNLQSISLSYCRFAHLKSDFLSSFTKLENVYLSFINICKIDSYFFNNLGYMNIKKLNLKNLNLINNKIIIHKINENEQCRGKLSDKLTEIEMDWSILKVICENNYLDLKNVQTLTLFINEMKDFESLTNKYLTVMTSLREISIFFKLQNFNDFQLNKELFDWFNEKQYNQIESIKIDKSNKIDSGCFINFKNLKKLSFTNCNLIHLNKNFFDGLNNLETLEFLIARIEEIDSNAFCLLNNLRNLNITKLNYSNGLIFLDPKLYVPIADNLENLSFYGFSGFDIYNSEEFKNRLGLRQETKIYGIGGFSLELIYSNENLIERMQQLYDTESVIIPKTNNHEDDKVTDYTIQPDSTKKEDNKTENRLIQIVLIVFLFLIIAAIAMIITAIYVVIEERNHRLSSVNSTQVAF